MSKEYVDEVTGELVTVEDVNIASDGALIVSTFGRTVAESKDAYNAVNNSEYLHEGMVDVPLEVMNVILERGTRRSRETGADVPCVNSYLVTSDGKSYFTQSSGIARGLASIARLVPDFKDAEGSPIKIAIRAKKLNNGNVLKVVEWL